MTVGFNQQEQVDNWTTALLEEMDTLLTADNNLAAIVESYDQMVLADATIFTDNDPSNTLIAGADVAGLVANLNALRAGIASYKGAFLAVLPDIPR